MASGAWPGRGLCAGSVLASLSACYVSIDHRAAGPETETEAGSTSASTSGDESTDEGSGTTGSSPAGSSTGEDTDEPPEPPPYEPARYPGGVTHSPITPYVADQLRDIARLGPDAQPDVFMKAGASSTVNHNTLFCFAEGPVDLGAHGHLEGTLDFYLGGDAAGTTPFDRPSEAAESGQIAGWVLSGDPSPLETELGLLAPRVALVHFGANDMGWGATRADALVQYHTSMMLLVDALVLEGVVPVLLGVTRRADVASAQQWVDTWNATTRAIAQARQIPFLDLYAAIDGLPGHGLSDDGLHLEAYAGGACILDDEGLQHGYNVRNLVALEALDRVTAVLEDGVPGLDEPAPPLRGEGTPQAPWVIDALPFTDVRDTSLEGAPQVDTYPGCGSTADESGPDLWYRLDVTETVRIRAVVLDMEGVDVDLHLVDESASGEGCIERGDAFVEATLEPGTYHLVLDTWVQDGTPRAGEALLVLVECDDDDAACD